MEKINHSKLVSMVAEDTGMKRSDVALVLESAYDLVVSNANNGKATALKGLGVFAPKVRASRTCRNPKTGDEIKIPEKTYMSFKESKSAYKARVERSREHQF